MCRSPLAYQREVMGINNLNFPLATILTHCLVAFGMMFEIPPSLVALEVQMQLLEDVYISLLIFRCKLNVLKPSRGLRRSPDDILGATFLVCGGLLKFWHQVAQPGASHSLVQACLCKSHSFKSGFL